MFPENSDIGLKGHLHREQINKNSINWKIFPLLADNNREKYFSFISPSQFCLQRVLSGHT